ncbi:Hypothetical protein FKW44_005571, partial [Caligus rogercresseyi]
GKIKNKIMDTVNPQTRNTSNFKDIIAGIWDPMLTLREQYLKYRISSGVYFTCGLLQNEGAICSLCENCKTVAHQFRDCKDLVHIMNIIKASLTDKIGRDLSPNEILYGFVSKDPKLRLASKVIAKLQSILARARFKNCKVSPRIAEVVLKEYNFSGNIFKNASTL